MEEARTAEQSPIKPNKLTLDWELMVDIADVRSLKHDVRQNFNLLEHIITRLFH